MKTVMFPWSSDLTAKIPFFWTSSLKHFCAVLVSHCCQFKEVRFTYQCLNTAEEHVRVKVVSLDVRDAYEPRGAGHRVSANRLLALVAGSAAVHDDGPVVVRILTFTGGRAVRATFVGTVAVATGVPG
jgi:hypothetical protein